LVTKATRAFVRERAKSRCEYCRAPEIITGGPFEVDHIVPQASAGGDEPENLALCCKSCNIRKSDHIFGIDPERREETPLFNPRQDAWSEHFDFDAERFQLLGRTPKGRATINQLRMNTSYQIEARKYWVEAAIYP
jgi:HNH endonuclease